MKSGGERHSTSGHHEVWMREAFNVCASRSLEERGSERLCITKTGQKRHSTFVHHKVWRREALNICASQSLEETSIQRLCITKSGLWRSEAFNQQGKRLKLVSSNCQWQQQFHSLFIIVNVSNKFTLFITVLNVSNNFTHFSSLSMTAIISFTVHHCQWQQRFNSLFINVNVNNRENLSKKWRKDGSRSETLLHNCRWNVPMLFHLMTYL